MYNQSSKASSRRQRKPVGEQARRKRATEWGKGGRDGASAVLYGRTAGFQQEYNCRICRRNIAWIREKVIAVDEGTNRHPEDYEFHSFLGGEDLNRFSSEEKTLMIRKGQTEGEGLIVPLEGLPESLYQRLLPHKIYDGLPWDIEKVIMQNGWQHFAEKREKVAVYVFNCCLLQNPMCETMMQFELPFVELEAYIREILRRIKELRPVIIYLSESRIADRIRYAAKERGEE